jgi:hypothetical protein
MTAPTGPHDPCRAPQTAAPGPARPKTEQRRPLRRTWRGALAVLLAIAAAGCVQRDTRAPAPRVEADTDWPTVVAQAKAFTLRIGFEPTENFTRTEAGQDGFSFCGRSPRTLLPYSYEDPAIEWLDSLTPEQCRSAAPAMDVYHGRSEALGEIATPVTRSMLASGVARMVYLVVHEDCHDQFSLPYGIEEPLCELISYRSMLAISAQPGPWPAAERRAIRTYALDNSALLPIHIRYYERLAGLYARHARGELSEAALLRERAPVFAQAETATGFPPGGINNLVLANRMTYARHYPAIERMYERLGSDLARLVALFRQVDETIAAADDAPQLRGRDGPLTRSGPRQRPVARAATGPAGKAAGNARSSTPPKAAGTAAAKAAPGKEAAAKPAPVTDRLAEIRATEAAVLETATRLLGRAESTPGSERPAAR